MSYEDAVKAVQITSINQSVDQMYYIMEGGNPRSAIRGEILECVMHIRHIVDCMGGRVWSNEWTGDVTLRDIVVPGHWRPMMGRSGTPTRSWPSAQCGAIVEHDGNRWQVVVNFVHGSISGQHTKVFSVYAIIPA